MVNTHGQLEDDDLEGSNIGDTPSESELEPGHCPPMRRGMMKETRRTLVRLSC